MNKTEADDLSNISHSGKGEMPNESFLKKVELSTKHLQEESSQPKLKLEHSKVSSSHESFCQENKP